MVIGYAGDLRRRVCNALVDSGAVVEVIGPDRPGLRTQHSGHHRARHLDDVPNAYRDAEPSYVVTVTQEIDDEHRSLLGRWRRRCHRRVETARLLAAAADATSMPDSCRILVVGDARKSTRTRASHSWIKHLAREVTYETEINGTEVDSATYLLVRSNVELCESLNLVAAWWSRTKATRASAVAY